MILRGLYKRVKPHCLMKDRDAVSRIKQVTGVRDEIIDHFSNFKKRRIFKHENHHKFSPDIPVTPRCDTRQDATIVQDGRRENICQKFHHFDRFGMHLPVRSGALIP